MLNSKEAPQKHKPTAILQKQESFVYKKNVTSECKANRELLVWYCQVCCLMLTSRVQAEEHFFGKRHQNLVRNKTNFDKVTETKIIALSTANKKLILDRLQSSSKSSFNQNFRICDSDDVIPPPGRDNILETVLRSERKTFYSSDLSIYRTPSGKYYCKPCNITVNSQAQFLQHSESRKHKHKASRASARMK